MIVQPPPNACISLTENSASIKVGGVNVVLEVADPDGSPNDLEVAAGVWLMIARRAGQRLLDERYEATLLYGVPVSVFRDVQPVACWHACLKWFTAGRSCDPYEITAMLYRYFGWCPSEVEELI
jgi:hypothetical protein